MLKRTPLFASHQRLGGRLIEFGGWEMPVQYTGIIEEHQAVRTAAGVFDISHMGEVLVKGPGAQAFLNGVLTNDLAKISGGQGQYTLMCREDGGVIDDLYAYCLGANDYLLVINASRIGADVAWLEQQLAAHARKAEVKMENASDRFGAIAVQGPRVAEFIDECVAGPATGGKRVSRLTELKKNEVASFRHDDGTVHAARTGYTGEDGFELIAPADKIEALWELVLTAGKRVGLKPAGLGARDTLRTEVCYPLYGHELDEQTTPIEAGVGFFVALEKGPFNGREVLAAQKAGGVRKKCVAFKMTDKSAPPRPHYSIWSAGNGGTVIGEVVSGTQSPSLGIGIGLGYVPPAEAKAGTAIQIEIRGKRFAAEVVAKPIYRKPDQTVSGN
jgi:aminomethyltransferase